MAYPTKRKRTRKNGSQAATGLGMDGAAPRSVEKLYGRRRNALKKS
jgi:hypothetical protein